MLVAQVVATDWRAPRGGDIPTITHGQVTKTSSTATSCSYQATCTDTGYECDTSTGLCGPKTCNSESGCTSLMLQYRNKASTLCKQTETQTCPTTGWPMNTGVGFNTPPLSGSTCTYTPKCTNGGTLYNGDTISSGATITCMLGGTGTDACTTDNLQTKFRPFNCVIPVTCPDVGTFGTLAHGTIETPTKPNVGKCKYQLSCNTHYTLIGYNSIDCYGDTCNITWLGTQLQQRSCQSNTIQCPTNGLNTWSEHGDVTYTNPDDNSCKYTFSCNSGYSLNPSSPTSVTCTGTSGTSGCTSSWLTSKLSSYSCQYNCPTATLLGGHGTITVNPTGDTCNYTLTCSNGYAEPNGNTTHTCTGSACTSGTTSVTTWANGLECKQKISCPENVNLEHGNVTWESTKSGTECTATVNCPAPSYSCSLGDNCTKTCSNSDYCDLRKDYYVDHSSDACSFGCPTRDYIVDTAGLHKISSVLGPTTQSGDKCRYDFSGCERCYSPMTSYALYKTCEKEECNDNKSGWLNDVIGYCYWTGGDGCGATQ